MSKRFSPSAVKSRHKDPKDKGEKSMKPYCKPVFTKQETSADDILCTSEEVIVDLDPILGDLSDEEL